MSTTEGNHDASHAHDDADGADGHHHGPPPPPEPKTPMWLPAVGALLFLSVGLLWALTTPPEKTPDLSGIKPTATTTATAPAALTATQRAPQPNRPAQAPQGHPAH